MPRLFWKLFLALWVSIMGFVVLTAWVNATLSRQDIPDPPEVAFARSIDKAEQMLGSALRRGGPGQVRERLRELPRPIRNHLYLIDDQGREILGRDSVTRMLERETESPERRVLRDRRGKEWTLVVLRRSPPGRFLEPGQRGIVMRLLLVTLFSAIVSWLLARSLARPLEHLGATSRVLADGDLSARVGAPLDTRKDEFGVLARDLDTMARRLDETQKASHQLLRDVSHELRSPLARQRVALELARGRAGETVAGELDRIELESERLETLIDAVLSLLRESSGVAPFDPEPFDLTELLRDLADIVSYEHAGSGSGIELQLDEALPVRADRELIWRAVENLLRNAMRYSMPMQEEGAAGGSGEGTLVENVITLSAHRAGGGRVELFVRDRGPGVPEAHLDRIFDPFARVDEARNRSSGGHGLGLSIAAAAVRRHGGTITARNRSSGGLELRLELPIAG